MIGVTIFAISSLVCFGTLLFLFKQVIRLQDRNKNLAYKIMDLERRIPDQERTYKIRLQNNVDKIKDQMRHDHTHLISQALSSNAAEAVLKSTNKAAERRISKVTQEFIANVGDEAEGLVRDLNFAISEDVWNSFQQFKEKAKDSPYIIPPNVRIYYTKGHRTLILIEQEPQVRLTGFTDSLATNNKRAAVRTTHQGQVYWYNLAFPYVYFLLVFDQGKYNYAEVYFSNKQIESPKDELHLAPLPNIFRDKGKFYKPICMGKNVQAKVRSQKVISEQCHSFLDYFWKNTFNSHLGSGGYKKVDPRMKNLKTWQASSEEDPLFVLTVDWPKGYTIKGLMEKKFDEDNTKHQLNGCDEVIRQKLDQGVKVLTERIQREIEAAKGRNEIILPPQDKEILEELLNNHVEQVFANCSKV